MVRAVVVSGLFGLLGCATNNAPDQLMSDMTAPIVVERVEPRVPAELRRVRGVVEAVGTIPKEGGRMRDIRIVHSEDSRLNEFVLEVLSMWTWKPGTVGGEAVDSDFRVKFSFPPK